MAGQSKNWREIRRQLPLNEKRVAAYRRLMEAEARLEAARRRQGVGETAFGDALDAGEADGDSEWNGDMYLSTMLRYVAALGGHLEVRAVFPEETVTLLREPGPG